MTRCSCRQSNTQKAARAVGFLLSGLALLLMPKCPACLAAYIVLLTGVSVSATVAWHLQTGLWGVCCCVLGFLVWQGAALFRQGRMATRNQRRSRCQS